LGPARELGTIFYSFGYHCTGYHAEIGRRAESTRENVARRISYLFAVGKLRGMDRRRGNIIELAKNFEGTRRENGDRVRLPV
jgi:hypothetical protein